MSEIDPIQQLIRLKRHEQPPVDFVEDFLRTFHQRQRAELLQQSARGLLWERLTTYFEDLMTPKLGWAFASVLAIGAVVYSIKPTGDNSSLQIASNASEHVTTVGVPSAVSAADERYLISGHYKGGLADDLNTRPRTNSALQSAERDSRINGSMLPAGLRISDDVMTH